MNLQDKEADKLLNKQGQLSGKPEPASKLSDPVGDGARSATDNGASPSTSKVSNDGNQSDTSKKSARPYNVAAALLLGGGVGCVILALGLHYACGVAALTAGIIAGVGAPLFLIVAAIVYCCGPTTSIENDGVIKQVAPSGTKEAVPGAS